MPAMPVGLLGDAVIQKSSFVAMLKSESGTKLPIREIVQSSSSGASNNAISLTKSKSVWPSECR
jgi:hypothetical protein